MRSRTWILIFAGLLAVLSAVVLIQRRTPAGPVVNVYQDNRCIRSIDLSRVTEPYSFPVSDGAGHENVVTVEPGRVRVSEANCPDQVCVNTGWISDGTRPIVCLPARLVIRLETEAKAEEPDIDGVVG